MKLLLSGLVCLITLSLTGQAVNEKIIVQLSQPPLLRVEAGSNINLAESGTASLGQSLYVTGGTPGYSYTWLNESTNVYNEKTPEVDLTGKYLLTVTDINNCSATDSLLVFDYGTGMNFSAAEMGLLIHFDPVQENMYLEMKRIPGPILLTITDTGGKVFYSNKSGSKGQDFTHTIQLKALQQGIYLLSIQNDRQISVHKFFLKDY